MNTRFKQPENNSKQINNQTQKIMETLENLTEIYSEHLWLKFTEEDLENAELATRYYANQTAKNYALFNNLCVNLVEKWLNPPQPPLKKGENTENLVEKWLNPSQPPLKKEENTEINHQVFSSDQNLARIWQFINGSVINIDKKRLILIPSEAEDLEGFEVEQEWVDIPNLAGDYYLPIRVDLETKYLHIWGFISRQTLKENAYYDEFDKLYIVSNSAVIDDLETLWMALDMCEEKGEVESLNTLTESEAQELIKIYSEPSPYSPRLKGNFNEWMSLLNDEIYFQKLDLETLIKSPDRPLVIFLNDILRKTPTANKKNKFRSLKQFTGGYRSPSPITKITKNPQFSVNGIVLDSPEKINQAIKNLATKSVEETLPTNLESEDILLHLLLKGKKQISGQAAEIFWAMASSATNKREIRQANIEILGNHLLVNMAIIQTFNQEVVLLLRVYSEEEGANLPQGLKLQWLLPDDTGNFIPQGKPAVAEKAKCLQLYYSSNRGENCAYEIRLNNNSKIWDFIV